MKSIAEAFQDNLLPLFLQCPYGETAICRYCVYATYTPSCSVYPNTNITCVFSEAMYFHSEFSTQLKNLRGDTE